MSVSLSLEKQAQAIDEEVDCGLLGTSQKRGGNIVESFLCKY